MTPRVWLGQATTGAGFATIFAAASGVASGTLTWQQAVPLLLGGAAGVIWPENTRATGAAEKAGRDLMDMLTTYAQMQGGPNTRANQPPPPPAVPK